MASNDSSLWDEIKEALEQSCPECRAGKHFNCTHESLNALGHVVPGCACSGAEHDLKTYIKASHD